ncbi:MAG: hypothetical protein KIT80_18360 [Chitinophagaceae bacterium]|nr:hypothetical protein [Chitinophagaceae bacterium]MCW5928889.1 hypothetical protein [Chitinophagaceae bacterium]
MNRILLVIIIFIAASCTTTKQSRITGYPGFDQALADSMFAYALDHEAIYTLLDTLKPISSVKFLRYRVAADSATAAGAEKIVRHDSLLHPIAAYQKICHAFSRGDWQFVLNPFARTDDGYRNIEIYVVRRSRFRQLLEQKSHFFGQWGFTPDADPATVLPVIEYEKKYDRYRAYGYLFGYPDYAVDFFVDAAVQSDRDTSIGLVPRDFFAIPVWERPTGHFTYAMPKGHQPDETDSILYRKAVITLEQYKKERGRYINEQGGFNATALWLQWNDITLNEKRRRKIK